MSETAKTLDWQGQGGSLEIPQGWCVIGADFDVENPYINIAHIAGTFTDKRLLVPKSLAYYLSTWTDTNHSHRQKRSRKVTRESNHKAGGCLPLQRGDLRASVG